ncbi:hypothetical protein DUNSADRAFT_16016 [Dunaliella salina]|uniref:Uncharacterized protein n=1 Tax=Dunaliella salina TaxID=3046 RepID=A0ABQ7H1B0_DUNSA|nr:hypothetical protein DUNSADRAFT_16016 [Dunaliella salina]|eukprot:KAF5840644.1 hypothetical protein DUNSADRAFT_16016 [Dunaliella salina]
MREYELKASVHTSAVIASLLLLAIGANTEPPRITTIFEGSSLDFWGLAFDPGQNTLFYSRTDNNDIREINLETSKEGLAAGDLSRPQSMAFSKGQVFISETLRLSLTQMNASNYVLTRLGGPFEGDALGAPQGMAARGGLREGLFVADRAGNQIHQYDTIRDKELIMLAFKDKPFSLAYNDNNADLYFAKYKGNQVFALNVDQANSGAYPDWVIAGQSDVADVIDGTGRDLFGEGEGTAAFASIISMVHDPVSETLYVGEDYGPPSDSLSVIRAIDTSSPIYRVTTVAGNSTAFLADDSDLPPKGVREMCILDPNNIAFVDSSNARIRRLTLPSPPPFPPPSPHPPPSAFSPLPRANAEYPRVTTIFKGNSPRPDFWGLAFDPSQNTLYYSRMDHNDIRGIDLDTGRERLVAGYLNIPKSMVFSRGQVYFSETRTAENTVARMNATNFASTTLTRLGVPEDEFRGNYGFEAGAPQSIAALPDGLAIADREAGSIYLYDTIQEGEIVSFYSADKPFSLAYNDINADLYFATLLMSKMAQEETC